MTAVTVRCDGSRFDGWTCSVTLADGAREISTHRVRVSPSDLERLSADADDPTALVDASFVFLLERESPQMILRSFELSEIARYFPEYESQIGQQAG